MTPSRFVKWWQDNPKKAEQIRKKRRERYAKDAEFRKKERERKRAARSKKQGFAKTYPRPKLYPLGDKVYELWSVGRVAETLGIHKRTLAGLESRGAIPTNRYVDVNGRRWWPKEFVAWLKPFFELKNNRKISSQEFSSRVWNEWNKALAEGKLPQIGDDNGQREFAGQQTSISNCVESNEDG